VNGRHKLKAINRARHHRGAVRAAKAMDLYRETGSQTEVARLMGISRRTARTLIARAKREVPILEPHPKPEPPAVESTARHPAPQVLLPPTNHPPVDELTRKMEWQRKQHDRQLEENLAINGEMGLPVRLAGLLPKVSDRRRKKKIADQLGFDPFEGTFDA
jgi:hypothetical protein